MVRFRKTVMIPAAVICVLIAASAVLLVAEVATIVAAAGVLRLTATLAVHLRLMPVEPKAKLCLKKFRI
jgi:hypothetical protein